MPSSTAAGTDAKLQAIKEIHPERDGASPRSLSSQPALPPPPPPPPSVMALAAAAQRAASVGRKTATLPHSHSHAHAHRRSQTIVVAGDLELDQIHKHKAVEDLHSELESKSKELEESQEEAQLAARIGQTLLLRNQEMGAQNETKAIALQNRAENAEQELAVMEHKLSIATAQIRSLDMARTRATLEAEQLTQELDESRARTQTLTKELTKATGQVFQSQLQAKRLQEELDASRQQMETMETAKQKLHVELVTKSDRIEVLMSTERYNVEHISRLEIENQSICQQNHAFVGRERQLQFENDASSNKLATQTNLLKESYARNSDMERALITLHGEMEELRDSLHSERARVVHLTRRNQELEARVDHPHYNEQHHHHTQQPDEDDESTEMLRNGSLFYELARQIKDEINEARVLKQQQQQHTSSNQLAITREPQSPEEPIELAHAQDSPAQASSTRTSRNPSSNATEGLDESSETATHGHVAPSIKPVVQRPPPLQLEPRRSLQQHEDEDAVEPAPIVTSRAHATKKQHDQGGDDKDDDGDLLKEFFMLTAAAVKSAGGGLRNDACNILNEDLYDQAMAQGVTFDQFHKWLESRLEDDLEISLSPVKIHRPIGKGSISRVTGAAKVAPPPTPSQPRASIISFWSR